MINIALDVMGGDNCPQCNLKGALEALKSDDEIILHLYGPEDIISSEIASWDKDVRSRVTVVNAQEVITTEESPAAAVRKKKNSSIVMGARAVREGRCDALVSAGSSGAVLAAGQLIVGRLPGVHRPPLASMIPTKKGFKLFLDLGANVDARPEWLVQFALMGKLYMQRVQNIPDPEIKLMNLGVEEEKGNALTKAANELLRARSDMNYAGYIETRDVIFGGADVIVADAFTGNAVLKTMESTVEFVLGILKEVLKSSLSTKLAALAIMGPLKNKMKEFSSAEQGGAMLLGLNGLVMKCHGNAEELDIKNAVLKSARFIREGTGDIIREAFAAENTVR